MNFSIVVCFFFFQAEDGIRDLTVTGVQTCALPIYRSLRFEFGLGFFLLFVDSSFQTSTWIFCRALSRILTLNFYSFVGLFILSSTLDRKSTRLNSSHSQISYAVFCLKKTTHSLPLS